MKQIDEKEKIYMSPKFIRITKVKPWAIYFNYKEKKFLLHESSDCYEYSTTLYERIFENGKYRLETIKSYYGHIFTLNYYSNKIGRTYKQIDKEKFVRKLIFHEMIRNPKMEKEIEMLKKQIEKYKTEEEKYRQKRVELEYQLLK